MARVCTACGLTKDADGNLIVNLAGVAGDNTAFPVTTTCKVSNGTHIYCDSDSGELYGEPEKFSFFRRVGGNFTPNHPVAIGTYIQGSIPTADPQDISTDGTGTSGKPPVTFSITNPSSCRNLYVLIEVGISHVKFDSDGPGDFTVEAQASLEITGSVSVGETTMGHQIWRHTSDGNEKATFDSMGARSFYSSSQAKNNIIIPPAGVITVTVRPYLKVDSATPAADCTIQNYTIDAVYWASSDNAS